MCSINKKSNCLPPKCDWVKGLGCRSINGDITQSKNKIKDDQKELIAKTKQELKKLIESKNKLEKEVNKTKQQNKELRNDITQLMNNIKEKNMQFDAFKQEMQDLVDSIKVNWTKLRKYANENKELKNDLDIVTKKLKKYVESSNLLQKEKISNAKKIEKYSNINKKLELDVKDYLNMLTNYYANNQELMNYNNELVDDIELLWGKLHKYNKPMMRVKSVSSFKSARSK